ncbi:hypothetical protein ACOMHN_054947 [Nucella lapillus]
MGQKGQNARGQNIVLGGVSRDPGLPSQLNKLSPLFWIHWGVNGSRSQWSRLLIDRLTEERAQSQVPQGLGRA